MQIYDGIGYQWSGVNSMKLSLYLINRQQPERFLIAIALMFLSNCEVDPEQKASEVDETEVVDSNPVEKNPASTDTPTVITEKPVVTTVKRQMRFCDTELSEIKNDYAEFVELLNQRVPSEWSKLRENYLSKGSKVTACDASQFPKIKLQLKSTNSKTEYEIPDLSDLASFYRENGQPLLANKESFAVYDPSELFSDSISSSGFLGVVEGFWFEYMPEQLFIAFGEESKSWDVEDQDFASNRENFAKKFNELVKLKKSNHYFLADCQKNSETNFLIFQSSVIEGGFVYSLNKHAFVSGAFGPKSLGCHQLEGLEEFKVAVKSLFDF